MRTFVLPHTEPRVLGWLRRVIVVAVCLQVALFCWSIYRRLWQVQRIEVTATSTTLTPAAAVGYDVVTSGEVQNLIRLEIVQGARRHVLLEQRANRNRVSAYDPRLFRYTPWITVGPEVVSRFEPGPATLRLTVFGGQKLLHTPAPRVRELQVRFAPRS